MAQLATILMSIYTHYLKLRFSHSVLLTVDYQFYQYRKAITIFTIAYQRDIVL